MSVDPESVPEESFTFAWPKSGSVPVTQFGFALIFSTDTTLRFTEGLKSYIKFDLSWDPYDDEHTEVRLTNHILVDTATGEETNADDPDVSFLVDKEGRLKSDSTALYHRDRSKSIPLIPPEGEEHKEGYVSRIDTRLAFTIAKELQQMWMALVQAWIDVPTRLEDNPFHNGDVISFEKDCVELGKQITQDPSQFLSSAKSVILKLDPSFEVDVNAGHLVSSFTVTTEKDTLRPHVADTSHNTEALLTANGESFASLDLKCRKWILGWPDIEGSLSDEYIAEELHSYLQRSELVKKTVATNLGIPDESETPASASEWVMSEEFKEISRKTLERNDSSLSGELDNREELYGAMVDVYGMLNSVCKGVFFQAGKGDIAPVLPIPSHKEVEEALEKYDATNDGKLDFEEFHNFLQTIILDSLQDFEELASQTDVSAAD